MHAPFIAGVIALAAPVGASATGIAGACYYGIVQAYGWDLVAGGLAINGVVLAPSAPALALWVRNARALRRQPLAHQWAYASAAWAATLIGCGVCLTLG